MKMTMRTRDCLRWAWRASRGCRGAVLLNALAGITQVSVSLGFIYVCKHLIDLVTGQASGSLTPYAWLMCGSLAVQALLSAGRSRLAARTEVGMRNRLRAMLFDRLMAGRWTGREAYHTGDVLGRLTTDVQTVTTAVCRTVPAVAVTLFQLGGALWLLSALDRRLALVVLLIMPVALVLSKGYVRRMRRLSREIRETDSRVQSHIQEHLQHRILIRTLEFTQRAADRLRTFQDSLRRAVMRRADISAYSRLMIQAGFSAGYAVAFLWGVFGLREGTVTFGTMAAFLQLVAQVQRPVVDIGRQVPALVRVLTAIERLGELSSLPAETGGDRPVRLTGSVGVRLEAVTFCYPDGSRNVLDAFSHDFRPGSLTAVVGETGVGKSTLMRLILALLRPDAGRVVFYDSRVEAEASPATRCNLSYVPQGNTLLSGTVRENLLMGNPQATDAMLSDALHAAAADFVLELPGGLDTLCGEQGAGLSEGQAQRIAIARGLLRPGGVLLLDEPTSSLDGETERLLMENLSHRVQGKTLIVITHREAVARLCTSTVRLERPHTACSRADQQSMN